MKLRIHVLYPSGEKIYSRSAIHSFEKDIVIMRKKSKDKPAWEPEISDNSLTLHKGIFRSHFHCFIKPEAPAAIPIQRVLRAEEIPVWDKKTSTGFIRAGILHRRGEEPKEKSNMAIWIIGILVMANIIITFLVSTGRLRPWARMNELKRLGSTPRLFDY